MKTLRWTSLLPAALALGFVTPAGAQLVEQSVLCYTGTGECACIRRFNYTQSDGDVVTLSATRDIGFDRSGKTWQLQSLPGGARTNFITDTDVVSIFNSSAIAWAYASTLIMQDQGQTAASPSGDWQLLWLSTDALRSLTNVRSVGVAATRISMLANGESFWIGTSKIYVAYDPWIYDQYGNKINYTWDRYSTDTFYLSLTSAFAHEFGHSLGLDDFRLSGPARAVMYDNLADPDHKDLPTDSDCELNGVGRAYQDASVDAVVENFRVVADVAGVTVSWHASQEYDVTGYLVERAPNRFGPFSPVGTVAPSVERNYSLLDTGNSAGVWRLRQLTVQGDTLVDAADTISVVNEIPPGPPPGDDEVAAMLASQLDAYPEATLAPENIQPVGPEWSHWIAIVPDGWATAAQPLANFWQSRGYRTWVATLSDVGGVVNIKNYLNNARAYGYLRAVLLVGDANDYAYWANNALWINGWVRPTWPAQSQYNILPMGEYVIDNRPPGDIHSIGGWTPYWSSDWAYVDFDNDHMPDLDIGRAPVRSANQLTLFVQKVLNVMAQPAGGIPLNHVGVWVYARDKRFASGDVAAEIGQDVLAAIPPNRVKDVLWDNNSSLFTQDQREVMARSAMESGRGLIAVSGTASSQANWCDWWVQHEFSWPLRTAGNWRVQPFLVGAACGIAAVDLTEDPWPSGTSGLYSTAPMIEQALTDPTRGPFGCFGPTRAGQQRGHQAMERSFLDALFVDNAQTAGAAARLAVRRVMAQQPEYSDLARSYILIGDPFMPIRTTVAAPTVTISGPSELSKGGVGTYTATAGSGDGSYTYAWYRRSSPEVSWSYIGSGRTVSQSMAISDFIMRCEVSSAGLTGADEMCVVYELSPNAITASMSGPTSLQCGEPGSWAVSASGGRICREYAYAWRTSTDGGATWGPVVCTAKTYTANLYSSSVLKATVSAMGGEPPSTSVTHTVGVGTCGGGGGGGGCPVVDTRTESGWITENSILGRSIDGSPLVDYYRLKAAPAASGNFIELRIRENELERTTLYGVRLLAVDHPDGVRVSALDGKIVAGSFVPAASVTRRDGSDITEIVNGADAPGFLGEPGELLTVTAPDGPFKKSVFSTQVVIKEAAAPSRNELAARPDFNLDSYVLRSTGLTIQAPDAQSGWIATARRYPREFMDETAVAVPEAPSLRLAFTGRHRVRSLGWLVPAEGEVRAQELALERAQHTRLGDSKPTLDAAAGTLTLETADTLVLAFRTLPVPAGRIRDYFLVTTGQYTSNQSPVEHGASAGMPERFALLQNEPNPFSGSTVIRMELPHVSQVRLAVYDLQGRLVRQLLDGPLEVGRRSIEWDRRDRSGHSVQPGVYLYRMVAEEFQQTRRMVVLPSDGR